MPSKNVEVVRAMYERPERGDMYVGQFVHPDIEFARFGSEAPDFAGGV